MTPKGTAATAIIIVITAVPTIAGKIPPFVIPSFGNSDKNVQFSFGHPPTIVIVSIEIIINIISRTETPVMPSTIISFTFLFIYNYFNLLLFIKAYLLDWYLLITRFLK